MEMMGSSYPGRLRSPMIRCYRDNVYGRASLGDCPSLCRGVQLQIGEPVGQSIVLYRCVEGLVKVELVLLNFGSRLYGRDMVYVIRIDRLKHVLHRNKSQKRRLVGDSYGSVRPVMTDVGSKPPLRTRERGS